MSWNLQSWIKHQRDPWAQRHRAMGHHPHPAPTPENEERWDCDYPECKGISRSLTPEQIRQKYAHLATRKRPEAEPCRYADGTCSTHSQPR